MKETIEEKVEKYFKIDEKIGWENLPKGWTKKSVMKFAKSLTGKDDPKDNPENFFTKCYERIKDEEGFDEKSAKKLCASLKDHVLGRTDWRGEDEEED